MTEAVKNIYVTTQGATVRKETGTIVVAFGDEILVQTPIKEMGMLVLFGNIQVTTQALTALLQENIDVAFLTQNGHFKGKVVTAKTKNCFLRRDQHHNFANPAFALELAKKTVKAKHANGIQLLSDYSRNSNNNFRFENRGDLEVLLLSMDSAINMEQLLGYEGMAAKLYFEDYGKCFTGELKFIKREYFPSPDPVNALLSFGYSFIAREVQAILECEGLDPYIGFYHQLTYGRASLSLDLIEPFRHGFIDRLVLKLVNKKMLGVEDFETGENGGVYLKKSSITIFIKAYEEACNRQNNIYKNIDEVSFRKIFWQMVANLKSVLKQEETYKPWEA